MLAPQVDHFPNFKTDFQALVTNGQPYDTLVIHPELLQHNLLKELLARLSPSRILKLPLDAHGARAIRDALDALTLYSHYAQAALWRGDVVKEAYITEQLPNFWKWSLWLLHTWYGQCRRRQRGERGDPRQRETAIQRRSLKAQGCYIYSALQNGRDVFGD